MLKNTVLILSIFSWFIFAENEQVQENTDSIAMHAVKTVRPGPVYDTNLQEEDTTFYYTEKHPLATNCLKKDGFFFAPEFLCWSTKNSGFFFSYAKDSGKIIRTDTKVKPGCRLYVGYTMPHDIWQIYTTWTYHHQNNSKSLHSTTYNFIGMYAQSSEINEVVGKWQLNYNALDLVLARPYYPTSWLTLTPVFGPTVEWLYQDFFVSYDDQNPHQVHRVTPLTLAATGDYWGAGLKACVNTMWHMNSNFAFYGNLAISGLFGKQSLKQEMIFFRYSEDTMENQYITAPNYEVKTHFQFMFGLSFARCYDSSHALRTFNLKCGMEINTWPDQYPLIWVQQDASALVNKSIDAIGFSIQTRFEF